jgi:hypothetical protein
MAACVGPDRVACAVESAGLAEPEGLGVAVRPEGPALAAAAGLAAELTDRVLEAVAVGGLVREWLPGLVAGLNVATESMAPATRHTARMLASSGSTVPCPNGAVTRRSRFLRRWARSSRW